MTKKLAAKVREYEKDGKTKGVYVELGVILENDNGPYALLDPSVNLAGVLIQQRLLNPQKSGDKVLASIFDDKPRETKPAEPKDDFDDQVPF